MPQYTIRTTSFTQHTYYVDAQSEDEARQIWENEPERCEYDEGEIEILDEEQFSEAFLSKEENYPMHWTSDEDLSADDIRRQHALSGLPDPTNDELATMFATMGAQ